MENASRVFSAKDVKERTEHKKTAYNWQFEFLAADQDALAAGESLGIDHDSCMEFSHEFAGVEMLSSRMNHCMDKIRKKPKK